MRKNGLEAKSRVAKQANCLIEAAKAPANKLLQIFPSPICQQKARKGRYRDWASILHRGGKLHKQQQQTVSQAETLSHYHYYYTNDAGLLL